jgi:hypothetical protein
MLKSTLCASVCLVVYGIEAGAATIASTSFEEPSAVGVEYTDTGDSSLDHDLVTNVGESLVNHVGSTELGFSSRYVNSRNSVGLTDGDAVGVTADVGAVGAYTHGVQGFQFSDTDGQMILSLDTVDLSGFSNTRLSFDLFVSSTTWETSDSFRAWVDVDGGNELDVFSSLGLDINDLGVEGQWTTHEIALGAHGVASLMFALDSNAGPESVYIDNVQFTGDPSVVPIPAAAWLFGSAVLGLVSVGRRRKATVDC